MPDLRDGDDIVARLTAQPGSRLATIRRIGSVIVVVILIFGPATVIAQDARPTSPAVVVAYAPDLASVKLLLLRRAGIDFSVPESDIKQWLGDRQFTPYPVLTDSLLLLLEDKHLKQPVYLDVVVWNYEHARGASSPRDIFEVDFSLLRAAVVQGYNERYGETVGDVQSLLQ